MKFIHFFFFSRTTITLSIKNNHNLLRLLVEFPQPCDLTLTHLRLRNSSRLCQESPRQLLHKGKASQPKNILYLEASMKILYQIIAKSRFYVKIQPLLLW